MGGESARPGKRPQRALTTLEKIEAIVRVHEGESKASVARDIGVPESTLRGWCKSEQKLRDTAARGSPESGASSPASTSGPLASSASGLQLSSALAAAAAAAAAAANNSEDEAQQVPSTRSRQSSRKRKSELAEDCLSESTSAGIVSSSVDSASSATCGGSSITVDSSTTGTTTTTGCGVTSAKQPKLDYVQSLLTSLAQVNGGLRSAQDNSLLLQQLNLLSKVQSTAALGNLMGLAAVTAAATNQSSHNLIGNNNNNSTSASFVENGLQYSKSNNSSRGASRTSSAVAPTSHPDSVGKSTRKSLPPAAEAPISLVPSSPRSNGLSATTMTTSTTTTNNGNSSSGHKYNGSHHSSGTGVKKDSNGLTREQRQHEETLRLWLQQQQALLGHANTLNQQMAAASDGSWFWQWYKQCSYPSVAGASLSSSHVSTSSNSPSKVKAVLDNVLSENTINNNSSHTIKRNLNSTNSTTIAEDLSISGTTTTSSTTSTAVAAQDEKIPSSEEAIEYGEKFFKWLNRCSDPSVTQMQIMQFKFLLDSLKSCRANKTASLKHSRK